MKSGEDKHLLKITINFGQKILSRNWFVVMLY